MEFQDVPNNIPPTGMVAQPATKKGPKSVETVYQKKTQLEHILLRPDTYIGEFFSVKVYFTNVYEIYH